MEDRGSEDGTNNTRNVLREFPETSDHGPHVLRMPDQRPIIPMQRPCLKNLMFEKNYISNLKISNLRN